MRHAVIRSMARRRAAVGGLALLAVLLALGGPAAAQVVMGCNFRYTDGAGPYDYRNERQALHVVERRHFTPKVERLQGGESTTHPGPDISYTLSKFPNHHRALLALSRLSIKLQVATVPEMQHSVDCYFERALRFRSDDNVARLAYAMHLARTGRKAETRGLLETAAATAADNPITHVNIGLLALEVGDTDRALRHAHKVQELGLEKNNLRSALERAGKWQEPAPAAAAASAPQAAPGPASAASAP